MTTLILFVALLQPVTIHHKLAVYPECIISGDVSGCPACYVCNSLQRCVLNTDPESDARCVAKTKPKPIPIPQVSR